MSDISKIKVSGVEYDITDIQAREGLGNLGTRVTELEQHGGGSSVPKPLTYDYMPEGYPKKTMGTVTVMAEQQLAFALVKDQLYGADLQSPLEIVEGQTYTVNWDGTEYECVCYTFSSMHALGNLSIMGAGDDTAEPFLYVYNTVQAAGSFGTLDTSASHTISVKRTGEIVTPMAEEFLPATAKNTTVFYYSDN